MSEQALTYPGRSIWGSDSILKRKVERHSVEADVKEFCGWQKLRFIVKTAKGIGHNGLRDAVFVVVLFECGGRVTETLLLKPSTLSIIKRCQPNLVMIKGMPLLKRYKKLSDIIDDKGHKHYQTKHVDVPRDFALRIDEPLVLPMLKRWAYALEHKWDLVFPSPYTQRTLTRKWAYQLIDKIGNRIGEDLWPHWFRAMRASQMASEYEFKEASLLEWFQWKSWMTTKKYAKLGPLGLAKKMGVRFRKTRGLKLGELEDLAMAKTEEV